MDQESCPEPVDEDWQEAVVTTITEADVEHAALDWLATLGWGAALGSDIALDTPNAERDDYGAVVLEPRLRDTLAALNPGLPVDALDDAYRKLTRSEGSTLEARNRAFHRMLVNGVEIAYRQAGGRVRGDLVRLVDIDDPASNDWLAVNHFTVTENRSTRRPNVTLFVNGPPLGTIELKNQGRLLPRILGRGRHSVSLESAEEVEGHGLRD